MLGKAGIYFCCSKKLIKNFGNIFKMFLKFKQDIIAEHFLITTQNWKTADRDQNPDGDLLDDWYCS